MENTIDKEFKNLFNEINYDLLPSQSNIYGVSCFKDPSQRASKVLVGLIEGRIFVSEYSKSSHDDVAKCVNREVTFTYIPSNCHIISLDSFSCVARGIIIGITFCKESSENFLNIYCNYGDNVPVGQEWNLDHVAQTCKSYELPFTPFQLTHCKVKNPITEKFQTVFILLGSDGCFHVYSQYLNEGEFRHIDQPANTYFIELIDSHETITYLEIKNLKENRKSKRLSVFGCTFGKIKVFLVDVELNTITSSWSIEHDSPIAKCQLFTAMDSVHLVIISARELAVIYCNILKNGLTDSAFLSESDQFDCATCCAVADINYDGNKEILIGTYGCKILSYSFDFNSDTRFFAPLWIREFSAPILKIKFVDIIGDGIDEMIVVTANGIHTLQSNLTMLLKKCKKHLDLPSDKK